jgi:hypothetical protein
MSDIATVEYPRRRALAGTPEGEAYAAWLESLPPAAAAAVIRDLFILSAPEDKAADIAEDLQIHPEAARLIAVELNRPQGSAVMNAACRNSEDDPNAMANPLLRRACVALARSIGSAIRRERPALEDILALPRAEREKMLELLRHDLPGLEELIGYLRALRKSA